MSDTKGRLDDTLGEILARRKARGRLRKLSNTPTDFVDFSSNGYLSLSTNLEIQKSLLSRLQAEVATPKDSNGSRDSHRSLLGSGGSRLLDGNSPFAESLEDKIASFHGAEAALLFTSAYDANTGLLGSVPQPGDVIIYDELIHASVHEGMRVSRAAKKIPFAHSSISEAQRGRTTDTKESRAISGSKNQGLGHVLRELAKDERVASCKANVFICVEGLYSMDGDTILLKEIVETVDQYLPSGNGYIIVDEAHSVGVFGKDGRGLVCQLGLEDRIWARVLGFGKAIGCAGGVVLCSPVTRSYLINYAKSLIYTTSMTFTSLASIDVVYDFLVSGQSEPLRRYLETLIYYTRHKLCALYTRLRPDRHTLYVEETTLKSPIIPVLTASPRSLAEHCQRFGFMVRPIVSPTVPAGSERVRICLHFANTKKQVDELCDVIEAWVRNQMSKVASQGNTESLKLKEIAHVFAKGDKPRL
ncbi:PLP-dependent transferase [Daldinia caldariorum]|uniref:PLP-dependent transferase n=1 Tax=Daldinia caldariorum TaxID=326644 RepID=UPI002007984D|nr:PLP-dependent transferase [Daldinia caldariorum]KAI1472643.1 PLP-dependent transferase [Daldinia caldariorum]